MNTKNLFLVLALIFLTGIAVFLLRNGSMGSSETIVAGQNVDILTDKDQDVNQQALSKPGSERSVGSVSGGYDAADSRATLRQALREASQAEALASERVYLTGQQSVDAVKVSSLLDLEQDEFYKVIDRFHSDAFDDPLAQELTELYQESLAEKLPSFNEELSLDKLACGLRVCVGAISGPAGFDKWDEFTQSYSDNPGSLPIYVAFNQLSDAHGSGIRDEFRMFFSIDPENNSVAFFSRGL